MSQALPPEPVFFLMDLNFEGGSSIARDTLRDGTFRFTGSVEAPVKIGLSSQAISTMLECWIGPGATTAITGEGPFPAAWKIESDLPEQTESNRYDEVSREMSLLRQQYHAEFMSIYNKLDLSKDSVPPRLFSLQTSRDSAGPDRCQPRVGVTGRIAGFDRVDGPICESSTTGLFFYEISGARYRSDPL